MTIADWSNGDATRQEASRRQPNTMQHCVSLPDIREPVATFYMHEHSAINMAWLRHCDGFAADS